jgi:purine-binding chemotaxis protein CheW
VADGKPDVAARGRALQLVCFHLRHQEMALRIDDVRETVPMRPITPVFLTPDWLAGIFSLRGDIVPAIDLAPWLGMPRIVIGEDSRIVVVRHDRHVVGLLVDRLADLRTLDRAELAAPPPTLPAEVATLLAGVAATPTGAVRVLDTEALFRSDRMRALAREEGPAA